jgi:hypothetical protein
MTLPAPHRTRALLTGLALAVAFSLEPMSSVYAQDSKAKSAQTKADKAADKKKAQDAKTKDAKSKDSKPAKDADKKASDPGKASSIGVFGEWGAYQTQGKQKTCYALAQPKTREPEKVKRDSAYVFISSRPAENVKNEISIIMGFPMKDGGEAQASIGDSDFSLIAKGSNAWVKNPAEESRFIDALKKGSKLVVKAASTKGKVTTDTYSLGGLSQALDKVRKECP